MTGERRRMIDALDRQRAELEAGNEMPARSRAGVRTIPRPDFEGPVTGSRRFATQDRSNFGRRSVLLPPSWPLLENYLDWMKWALGDLPWWAVAIRPDPGSLRDNIGACGLIISPAASWMISCTVISGSWRTDYAARKSLRQGRAFIGPRGDRVILAFLLASKAWRLGWAPGWFENCRAVSLRAGWSDARENGTGKLDAEYYRRLIELKNVDDLRILYRRSIRNSLLRCTPSSALIMPSLKAQRRARLCAR